MAIKKKKSVASKKLDPDQEFVIISVNRRGIAQEFNDIIDNEGWKIQKFTPDDPRLTDVICKAFTDGSNSASADVDDLMDREYEYHIELLSSEFSCVKCAEEWAK